MIDARLAQIATAQALTTDPAIVDALSLVVHAEAAQLRPLLAAVRTFDGEIAALFAAHPDQALFASFPGAGPVGAPRLAAAFGTDRTRWDATSELQSYAGIAPVRTQREDLLGASSPGLSEFLKQTFQSTRTSRSASPRGRAPITTSSAAAAIRTTPRLRSLAFKWMRILFRCWKTRTPYDEATYLAPSGDTGHHSSKKLLD